MEQEQNPSQRDALVENLKQQRAQFSNPAQIGRAVYESQAQQVIEAAKAAQSQRDALVENLKQQRADIDAALVALGVKRVRKAKEERRGPGRPAGSRNRKAKEVETNGAIAADAR